MLAFNARVLMRSDSCHKSRLRLASDEAFCRTAKIRILMFLCRPSPRSIRISFKSFWDLRRRRNTTVICFTQVDIGRLSSYSALRRGLIPQAQAPFYLLELCSSSICESMIGIIFRRLEYKLITVIEFCLRKIDVTLKFKAVRAQMAVNASRSTRHQVASYTSTTVANALATLVTEVVVIVIHTRTSTCTGTLVTVYMPLTRTYTSSMS